MNFSNLPLDFDWKEYLRLNPDLIQKGYDKRLAKYHWCTIGYKQGRLYKQEKDVIIELPFEDETSGGVQRMLRLAIELPHSNLDSGGVKETVTFAKSLNVKYKTLLRFQRIIGAYPHISNTWSVGLPDNTFPACDICITYSDNPYLEDLVNLPQVKKVFIYMLSYGMSPEREKRNILNKKVTVLCSTIKLQKLIEAEGVKVHRIGFGLEMNDMINRKQIRKKYLALLYHPSEKKRYELGVQIANELLDENIIDGVITFGTDLNYEKAQKPKVLVKHICSASREQICEIFNECICFLMPSESEGLNLTPIESTLCGCPAILCDGAINELFFHEKNCFITDEKLMMKTYIEKIVNNYDEIAAKFEKRMRTIVSRYDWESVVQKISSLM